jgi:hypothetical protein
MKKLIATVAFATLAGVVQPAQAQDVSDLAAFLGLSTTPYGALPAVVSPGMTGAKGQVWDLRYGRFSQDGGATFSAFGLGGNFGVGARGRLGIDVGYQTCDEDCDGSIMAGVDYNINLVQHRLGAAADASSMIIGFRPALGYGKPEDITSMSLTAEFPISMTFKVGTRTHMVPFLSPALGWGRISADDESESGTKTVLGGGLGFTNVVGNIGVNLGFRKIFVEDAPTQWGLGMSWSR